MLAKDTESVTPGTVSDIDPDAFFSPGSQAESPIIVSSHASLAHALHERRAEYLKKEHIKIKVGTWNVASLDNTERDLDACSRLQ